MERTEFIPGVSHVPTVIVEELFHDVSRSERVFFALIPC